MYLPRARAGTRPGPPPQQTFFWVPQYRETPPPRVGIYIYIALVGTVRACLRCWGMAIKSKFTPLEAPEQQQLPKYIYIYRERESRANSMC